MPDGEVGERAGSVDAVEGDVVPAERGKGGARGF
jgi:hypothetical protein